MIVRRVSANDLDVDAWDACVESDPAGLIYHTSWYLDMLGVDWDGLVADDYKAVMPLVYRKKYGVTYAFRPFGVQQLGPVGERSDAPETLLAFLTELQKHVRFADVFIQSKNVIDSLPANWRGTEQVNLVLNLNTSYESLYSRFNSNTKRNIKKAQKAKFNVFEHDPPEVLIRLFQTNQGEKYPVSDEFYKTIGHVMHVLLHKKLGKIWTVHDERNSPVAGIFTMVHKGRHTLLFSAADEYAREHQALTFLINEFLLYQCEHAECFDFEGSNVEGLRRFYAGFGALEENYYHLRYNGLPWPLSWLKRA